MAIAGALSGAGASLYFLAGNTEFFWQTWFAAIQFVIMQASTSLILSSAFTIPGMQPQSAPASMPPKSWCWWWDCSAIIWAWQAPGRASGSSSLAYSVQGGTHRATLILLTGIDLDEIRIFHTHAPLSSFPFISIRLAPAI